MLHSLSSQLHFAADAVRQAADLAAWDATKTTSATSYFYGYWFSHWRA